LTAVAAAAALAAAAGPEGITAGNQVCISYGNWPAEPFLLLFGFVPQPNPHDCIPLFSSLQHMADCYLECCDAALQTAARAGGNSAQQGPAAATAARQLLQSERLRDTYAHQVESIEDQLQQQQQEGGPGGYRDMIVSASGVDGRLAAALSYMHQAVAVAAAEAQQERGSSSSGSSERGGSEEPGAAAAAAVVQQLQLPLGAVLQHRLQQAVEQLEHSRDQTSSSSSSVPSSRLQQQDIDAASADGDGNSSCYTESAAHRELIEQYCSSKAALARQLAGRYSGTAAS
jgi:hypothetical protein